MRDPATSSSSSLNKQQLFDATYTLGYGVALAFAIVPAVQSSKIRNGTPTATSV